MNMNFIIMNQY